jgi:hypothetical protein
MVVCMKASLFNSFAEMIDDIPSQAVPRAVELERCMLEDDWIHKRISSLKEMISILSFGRFINAIIHGDKVLPVELPVAHVAFYRKTVMRLIEIGALPFSAKEEFDHSFSPGFLETLATY